MVTHQCVSCVVDVCPGSQGKCVAPSPCDGTNQISVYCPCDAGEVCDVVSGDCV
jgi:hypothetical protein